jgi:hypothetical protein
MASLLAPEPTTTPDVIPEPMTAKAIKAWAKDEANRQRARALGARLIAHQKDPDGLLEQESLGAFEDAATRWAIDNKRKARLLLMRLAPLILG